jgi:hypothetical protein
MDLGEAIALIVGIIGTGVAIYQWAVINESKKRKGELQFILAGINNVALQKQQSWQNQINLLPKPDRQEHFEAARPYLRARDDFAELAGLTAALEGAIDTDSSAISTMLDKGIDIVQKNNKLQEEGLKNPASKKKEIEN